MICKQVMGSNPSKQPLAFLYPYTICTRVWIPDMSMVVVGRAADKVSLLSGEQTSQPHIGNNNLLSFILHTTNSYARSWSFLPWQQGDFVGDQKRVKVECPSCHHDWLFWDSKSWLAARKLCILTSKSRLLPQGIIIWSITISSTSMAPTQFGLSAHILVLQLGVYFYSCHCTY